MRAVTLQKRGAPVAPSVAYVEDWPEVVDLARGEALIRTEASALNQMDIWVGKGVPGLELTYPRVSGCDACGTIEAVGEGVDQAWIGRRVIVNAALPQPERIAPGDPPGSSLAPSYHLIGEHLNGMHKERFAAPVSNLADVGAKADPRAAAAFGLVTLTAYSMMRTKGNIRPGQSVLITGIGGGVATAALSICRWLACPAIVTSRHQWKLDKALKLGAAHAILDEGQDWSRDVRRLTDKRGVDMAVDSIGKPTHMNCIKSLARGGAFVTPGNTGGPIVETDQARIFWNQLRIFGSTMGNNDEWREIAALFRTGVLQPVIDQAIPAAEAQRAWQRLEASEQFGKIVLDWTV